MRNEDLGDGENGGPRIGLEAGRAREQLEAERPLAVLTGERVAHAA